MQKKDKSISIRLSPVFLEALDACATLNEKDRTQIIREAIAKYLSLPLEDYTEDRINYLKHSIDELNAKLQTVEKRIAVLENWVLEFINKNTK